MQNILSTAVKTAAVNVYDCVSHSVFKWEDNNADDDDDHVDGSMLLYMILCKGKAKENRFSLTTHATTNCNDLHK